MAAINEEAQKAINEAVGKAVAEKQAPTACPNCLTLDTTVKTLQGKLKEAESEVALPTVKEFVEHCVDCPDHKADLDKLFAAEYLKWAENMSEADAQVLAERHGLWPPPTIVIEEES